MLRSLPVRRFFALVLLLAGVTAPSRAAEQLAPLSSIKFENLCVEISAQDSNFTVVDARMDETMTAGVFFGVVGAGVNSAANAGADDKKADTLREAAAKIDVKGILEESLRATLAA